MIGNAFVGGLEGMLCYRCSTIFGSFADDKWGVGDIVVQRGWESHGTVCHVCHVWVCAALLPLVFMVLLGSHFDTWTHKQHVHIHVSRTIIEEEHP